MSPLRIVVLTTLTMLAFAGNSLLCRIALGHTAIDAASFTTVRLVSGALMLWILVRARLKVSNPGGNWGSALALFAYAASLSFSYASLTTATGALLLFGAVQATMIGQSVWRGERLRWLQLTGLALALGGAGWPAAAGLLCAAIGRFITDAEFRRRVGDLFIAWQRHGRSCQRDGRKFSAGCFDGCGIKPGHGEQFLG